MTKHRWVLRLALCVVAVVLIGAFCRVTVVPNEKAQTVMNEQGEEVAVTLLTVAEQYCADNWDALILPTIAERAIEPSLFVQGLTGDLAALGSQYAARANETSAWSFCLRGTATVLDIENPDAKTKTRLRLDVPPYDGVCDLKVQVSTVLKTNAIRDAVGFLKLDNFANQVEFAELTKAFNARVQKDVLSILDLQTLVGKEIELTGCVSVTGAKDEEALVVPVRLALMGV